VIKNIITDEKKLALYLCLRTATERGQETEFLGWR